MPIRLPSKYKRILDTRIPADERKEITTKYKRRRVISIVAVSAIALSSVAYVVKDYADSRFSPVEATEAVNRQDLLQEQEDVVFFTGEAVEAPAMPALELESPEKQEKPEETNTAKQHEQREDTTRTVVASDNILLVGMDSRAGANGELGAGSAADVTGTRTDSIMFLHIPESGAPSVVSLPRDLSVTRQDCAAWDGSQYDSHSTIGQREDVKINSVYGAGGPRCLVRTVQSITGMKINRFVSVDFAGFQGIVDALGGVEVEVDQPVIDGTLGSILPEAGKHHLDGSTALDFVRARSVEGEFRSDYDRIERQQQFGMAVLNTMASSSTLSNPAVLNDLSNAIYAAVSGENINSRFILDVLTRAKEFANNGVNSMTIPTSGTNESGNEIMDEFATQQMMLEIATE